MTADEHVESDIKLALKCYENHVAEVRQEGELTVVDWRIPGSEFHYFVHLVFDPRRNMVYVTGDFGAMVIQPTCPITIGGMARTFTKHNDDGTFDLNIGYFLEKVECAEQLYKYDADDAAREVRERYKRTGRRSGAISDEDDVTIDDLCDAISSETDDEKGCNLEAEVPCGVRISEYLEEIDPDYSEWAYDLGEYPSQQVVFTLMAFRMTYDWVEAHKEASHGN